MRAMRPQWYLQHLEADRDGPAVPNEHLWLGTADRSSRSSAWSFLLGINEQYEALKKAASPRAKGQKGTTEPWQNPAREISRLHGPCWLAADIAIIGAATQGTLGSGSFDRGGESFGENIDYGTFVLEVHRHPASRWWKEKHDTYSDSLSRRTWALALLATANEDIVIEHLGQVEIILDEATDADFFSIAASSSRLGATRIPRRLGRRALEHVSGRSPRTVLLVSHFASSLHSLNPLEPLARRWRFDEGRGAHVGA